VKRKVLKAALNLSFEYVRSSLSIEFQNVGPATGKARRPGNGAGLFFQTESPHRA